MVHRTSRILFVLLFAAIVSSSLYAQTSSGPVCSIHDDSQQNLTVNITVACNDANGVSFITVDWGDQTSPDSHSFGSPAPTEASFQFSHTYLAAGTYTIVARGFDPQETQGQPASLTVTVPNQPPTCDVSVSPSSGAALSTTFSTNGSCNDQTGDIVSITINWGDGTIETFPFSPTGIVNITDSHSYSAPGTFQFTVSATDSANNTTTTRPQTIVVTPNAPPACRFDVTPPSGAAPLAVAATGQCTDAEHDISVGEINWGDDSTSFLFGDDSSVPPEAPFTAKHTYQQPGTYTATLRVFEFNGRSEFGRETDFTQVVVVAAANTAPTCTVNVSPSSGTAFSTSFTATANCSDTEADINKITIDWGDGSTPDSTTVATPNTTPPSFSASHIYRNTTTTTFTITATATDTGGLSGSAQTRVTVNQNQPPTCTLTVTPTSGTAPLTVDANAGCNDQDDNVDTASIDWGDGSAPQSLNCDGSCFFRGSHTYTAPGTYMVVVTGTDSAGLKGSANQTVTVNQPVDSTPKCTLNSDSQNGAAPFTVTFNGSCQDAGNDLGEGSTGSVDFGDNTPPQQVSPASFSNVSHVYQSPGTYTATFTATDSAQHTGKASLTITVSSSTPICTLNADKQSGQAPLTVNFTGSCSDPGNDLIASSQTFDFGDGTPTQNGTSATHTYDQPGTYQATFSASDTHGNKGSTSQTITVTAVPNRPPSCTLSVSPQGGPAPLTVTATGNCTDPDNNIISTTLAFGDGTVQNGASGTHTYNTAGTFTITVTATDSGELSGSASQTVSASIPVNVPPTCILSVSPQNGPPPLTVTASGSCSDPENDIVTTTLDFGDGTQLAASSGEHTYFKPGSFKVTITATDVGNLSGTATQNITVTALAIPPGVFVGISDGTIKQFSTDGKLIKSVSTGFGGTVAGMAFDRSGTVYTTDFTASNVSKFDINGNLLGTFGAGYNCQPESIVFDGGGNAYVGQQGCSKMVLKFDSSGRLLQQFVVNTESQGSDQVELAGDECTLFYTSEGKTVFRYDVCKAQQLPAFSTSLTKGLSLRILADGGVVVSNEKNIVRLNSSGQQVMTYTAPGEQCWDALTLDTDGTSFWAADFCSSNIYKFDLSNGNQLAKFNTGTPGGTVFGIAMAGTGLNIGGVGSGGALTSAPQSASLSSGQSTTFKISFIANSDAVGHAFQLSCANLPPGVSYSFSPPTITPGAPGPAGNSTLTMSVGAATAVALPASRHWWVASAFAFLPAFVLLGTKTPRRRLLGLLLMMIVSVALLWSGCGGTSRNSAQAKVTPQGSFNVVVVGTSGGMQVSTPVNVTIH